MAAHPSALAREIPGTEEPGGHSPGGRTESDTTEDTHTHTQAVMLDIFSWAYLHSFLCVCEVSAFIFCPFKKLGCLFSYC